MGRPMACETLTRPLDVERAILPASLSMFRAERDAFLPKSELLKR